MSIHRTLAMTFIPQNCVTANKNDAMNQLKLALAWNRIDVVREEIFTEDKSWDVSLIFDIVNPHSLTFCLKNISRVANSLHQRQNFNGTCYHVLFCPAINIFNT